MITVSNLDNDYHIDPTLNREKKQEFIWKGACSFIADPAHFEYLVEPTRTIEDDPDLTDKIFPGNPQQR